MAALSVQWRGGGRKTRMPSYSAARPVTTARSRPLAATPPESTTRSSCSSRAARKSLATSAPTMASW